IQVGGVPERVELAGDRVDDGRMAVAEDVDRDPAEQVEVGSAVDVGDHRAVTAGQRQRWGAVVVHHHGLPPVLESHPLTTLVPVPSSVNSSTSTQCWTRPSMTWALGTPPSTARRQ